MTKWIYAWRKKDWKTAKGLPVINKEEVMALDKAIKSLDHVKWVMFNKALVSKMNFLSHSILGK